MTHKHKFLTLSATGLGLKMVVSERCSCGATRDRPATKVEKAISKSWFSESKGVHALWRRYQRLFKDCESSAIPTPYKYYGYDLMCRISRWAKRYPDDVRVCSIDDSVYAGSMLVFVEHRTKKSYHGTTVIVIPQCTGEQPLEFFMYADHLTGVMKAIKDIRRLQLRYPRKEW